MKKPCGASQAAENSSNGDAGTRIKRPALKNTIFLDLAISCVSVSTVKAFYR
jgi:hypothetical protein